MASDGTAQFGVCPVCEEVFEIDGELPVCESCLNRLDCWMPEQAEVEPLLAAA